MTTESALVLRDTSDQQLAEIGKEWSKHIEGFGRLASRDLMLAAQLKANGFQPFHFNILHGHLYLNMDGRAFWTRRAMGASYAGMTHKFMTTEEREAYGLDEDEVGVTGALWQFDRKGVRFEVVTDIGRAGGRRDSAQAVAKTNRAEMAIKRLYVRLQRTGAPLGVDIGTAISEDIAINDEGEVIDVEGKVIEEGNAPAEVLGSGSPLVSESTEAPAEAAVGVGADTPKLAAQGAPQGPQAPSVGSVPPAPANQPAVPLIKPRGALIEKVTPTGAVGTGIYNELRRRRVNSAMVQGFEHAGLKGIDAIMALGQEGYTAQQIGDIVERKAQPDTGWDLPQ
jgi:hypothetical protein